MQMHVTVIIIMSRNPELFPSNKSELKIIHLQFIIQFLINIRSTFTKLVVSVAAFIK